MGGYANRIIIISVLLILISLVDFFDNVIIRLLNLQEDGSFELIVDFLGPVIEVSLMIWAFLTGKKIIYQIKDEEEQYKRLVQLSPYAIIIHTIGDILKILYINDSGANLLGYTSTSKLINRNINEFVHPDSMAFFELLKEEVDKFPSKEFNQQVKIKRVDGAIIYLDFTSTKVEFNGQSAREVIARDISIERNEMENIKQLAYKDELTGLPNRRAFMGELHKLMQSVDRSKMGFSILFIDLDGFKQVNDTIGHSGGDLLLKHVSETLKVSIAQKGIIARLAGDEFIVLLQKEGEHEAVMVAKQIINSFIAPIVILGEKVRVTASIGIALYPRDGIVGEELIKNADIAMYRAKESGKNNYHLFRGAP